MASLFPDLLILTAAGAILALLVYLALRRPFVAALVILAASIVTQGVRDSYQFPLAFRDTNIYLLDLLSLALISVGVYRALSSRVVNVPQVITFALLGLLGVHFLRGASAYGVNDAFNSSRGFVYFIAPLVYASTVKRWDVRVWRLFPVAALALLGIACFYYLKDGYHAAAEFVVSNGSLTNTRPIAAAGALLVLESIILLSVLRWPSRRVVLALALVNVVGLVAIQDRTVWIAGLVAGLVGLGVWAARQTWNARRLAVGAAVALTSLLVALLAFFQSHSLNADVREMTSSDSTIRWRITGWRELIGKFHSLTDAAFGLPAGTSLERTVHNVQIAVSPHSLYVDQYLRFGIPGVILVVALGFLLWRRRAAIAPRLGLTTTCVSLLLLTVFSFGLVWQLDLAQGLILGIFIAALPALEKPSSAGPEDESKSEQSPNVLSVAAP
ncbi:MAG: O-antigen ligase family protein [Gaiellaceae bacterium]